jgi:hypothetical protein
MIWYELLAETAVCLVKVIIYIDFEGTKSFKFVAIYLSFSSETEMIPCQYDKLHCTQ